VKLLSCETTNHTRNNRSGGSRPGNTLENAAALQRALRVKIALDIGLCSSKEVTSDPYSRSSSDHSNASENSKRPLAGTLHTAHCTADIASLENIDGSEGAQKRV
jgi:hypothetical protein